MNNKKANLVDKLLRYINGTDVSTRLNINNLEVKPEEFSETGKFNRHTESAIEVIEKDKNSVVTNENKIVCDNILMSFFDLNDDKFFACLEKMNEWGFDITFREFIIDYYIRIIKDSKLRQYVVMNLNSILTMLKERMERNILNSIKGFNFTTTANDHEIELIKNDIKSKEIVMAGIHAKNFNEFEPTDEKMKTKLDPSKKKTYRMEVLNRLRYENPKLLE